MSVLVAPFEVEIIEEGEICQLAPSATVRGTRVSGELRPFFVGMRKK